MGKRRGSLNRQREVNFIGACRQTFENIDDLKKHMDNSIKKLITIERIKSLCSYEYLVCDF